ncbi:hypothetical protein [Alcanivorax sp.]|jgi:hypothetical protein|uniref:hypothetical protein n=1 Tax=Alcanivorax sp. TaxID=1872427 RepID=UPI0032D96C6C
MTTKSHIASRIEKAIESYQESDYEDALLQLFPAMDATAKKRYSKFGNAKRMKQFIADDHGIIWAAATGMLIGSINIDGTDLPSAVYKFARCTLIHEGGLDRRISFNAPGMVMLSANNWRFPPTFIPALIMIVVMAPENKGLTSSTELDYGFLGQQLQIDQLWGDKARVQEICDQHYAGRH